MLNNLGFSGEPFDINTAEKIVGRAVCDEQRPFLFENNVLTDLGTFDGKAKITGTARAINDAGQIIGESGVTDTETHTFIIIDDQMVDMNTLVYANDPLSGSFILIKRSDINSSGAIVGSGSINGQKHAFSLTPNARPVAMNGAISTTEDTAKSGVLNGSNPDGDAVTFPIVIPPSNGIAVITNAGTGTFT